MATTWQILNTKRENINGLVIEVAYACNAQLDILADATEGRLEFTGDPSDPGFIPYEDLTQAILLDWVKTALGNTEVTAIETTLENNLAVRKAEMEAITVSNGLPWL